VAALVDPASGVAALAPGGAARGGLARRALACADAVAGPGAPGPFGGFLPPGSGGARAGAGPLPPPALAAIVEALVLARALTAPSQAAGGRTAEAAADDLAHPPHAARASLVASSRLADWAAGAGASGVGDWEGGVGGVLPTALAPWASALLAAGVAADARLAAGGGGGGEGGGGGRHAHPPPPPGADRPPPPPTVAAIPEASSLARSLRRRVLRRLASSAAVGHSGAGGGG
jgi:hypothetical protein